jgi:hypothetical protein
MSRSLSGSLLPAGNAVKANSPPQDVSPEPRKTGVQNVLSIIKGDIIDIDDMEEK